MQTKALPDLSQFTGSETWWRHPINRKVTYTNGAKYVADTAGAYWLLDEIALLQHYAKALAGQQFQAWKLTVKDNSADLICEDGNYKELYRKRIPFTDFPAPGITLWFVANTILLPSEY